MFPSKAVVIVAIACSVTVTFSAEPRFLLGSSEVNHIIAGGNGGHGGNSVSGGVNSGSLMGINGGSAGQSSGYQEESYPPRPYNFSYAVKDRQSGVNFGHFEQSDGENVRGQYRVLLPDGRTQIVTYTANWRTGYNADVKYMGKARYPQQSSNSGFGWSSSGNEKALSGNRELLGSYIGGSSKGPSPGNGQSSGYGWSAGNSSGQSKGPPSSVGRPVSSTRYAM